MEEIDLKELFNYFISKLWIIILAIVIVMGIGSVYTFNFKTPMYKSTTTVILASDDSKNNTITQSDITINKNLVGTYTEIIKSKSVINEVIAGLYLDDSYEDLASRVSVAAVDDTEIISISATDTDSNTARVIADSIAFSFETKVKDIYNMKNVSILDYADASDLPSNINIVKEEAIYFAIGFVISALYIFLRFYFDRTIKNANEVENKTELAIMGSVRNIKKELKKDSSGNEIVANFNPKSGLAEDVRTIRTNLEFSGIDKNVKTILITSSIPGEGKSFISSNLATTFAQNDKKVLLIDGDLRKGRLHNIFKLRGKGLSNLIAKNDIKNIDSYVNTSKVNNLSVITRGVIAPNPSELLNSKVFTDIIKNLSAKFDYIIIDGAPIANLPDSLIISKNVDKTLLISSIGYTPIDAILASKKSLENVNASVAGVIVNKVPVKKGGYYYSDYKYE